MRMAGVKAIEERFFKFVQTQRMFSVMANRDVPSNKKTGTPLRVGVGVSGGPDSVCLAMLLKRYQKQMNIEPIIIHVNHHLRGEESDRDEDFVRKLSEDLLDFKFVKYDLEFKKSELKGNSLEAIAREKRYRIFENCIEEFELDKIALAHTMNDNAETMLINMLRGTGVAGISGIPPVRDYIVRPMLILSRENVLTYLKLKHVAYMTDSTNELPDYLRNQIRLYIIPELMKLNPGFLNHMFFLSNDIREIGTFLVRMSKRLYKELVHTETSNLIRLDIKRLLEQDDVMIKSVVQIAIKTILGMYYNPRREHIDYVMNMLKKTSDNSRRLEMLPKGLKIYKNKEFLIFERSVD
ncbi:MAG: tRNA lysidine(34) synthetase TilS [bacterium]